MNTPVVIKARVSTVTKRRVADTAQRELLTESIWLRRLVHRALQKEVAEVPETEITAQADTPSARISIRLPPEDRRLLQERATARGMATATYISVLTRSHLRHLSPLPKVELLALRATVSELGAIGRNLNQLARAVNQGTQIPDIKRGEMQALLKVCQGLRENTKKLIQANLASWSSGHAEAPR
jgi:hypothetical protein